jgi:TIR domain-containing protein
MFSSPHLKAQHPPLSYRDIFLSHRSVDKDFTRMLARDIEAASFQDRSLLTWIDEAEIGSGQSVTGMVNEGLEKSRYIGLVMTPAYFERESSGWTDAEWHAALFEDPDNRRASIIPLLVTDCPLLSFGCDVRKKPVSA